MAEVEREFALLDDDEWATPNLAECRYYQGVGSCSFGCRDEPECMTCEPPGGWPVIERHPYAEQGLRALRYSKRMRNWLGWLTLGSYPDHLKTYVTEYSYRAPTRHDILRWMNGADPTDPSSDEEEGTDG
jgi:hypothetical protein